MRSNENRKLSLKSMSLHSILTIIAAPVINQHSRIGKKMFNPTFCQTSRTAAITFLL